VFKYRNYDPALNRWTAFDPCGFPDGANNNVYAPIPTKELDALGLFHSGTSYSSLLPPYSDVTDRAAWTTGKVVAGPLQTSAMNHADGTSSGNWTLSSAEVALVKATVDYSTTYRDYVYSLAHAEASGKGVGFYALNTPEYDLTFTHGTDAYYAFGDARFEAVGSIEVFMNSGGQLAWRYEANVILSDYFTFSPYATVPTYSPTGIGYRLETHGYIAPFDTSALFPDTWDE